MYIHLYIYIYHSQSAPTYSWHDVELFIDICINSCCDYLHLGESIGY